MPSPWADHPGLFLRDPFRYSDEQLVIPPALVECLNCFDGTHTDLDLRETLFRITGRFDVSEIQQYLLTTLGRAGFLEDKTFEGLREARHREFAASARREAAHAGLAYPADAAEIRRLFDEHIGPPVPDGAGPPLCGIAAPHVSPEGAWDTYRAAYTALSPAYAGCTFLVLATSHFGESDRFGLTRKPFLTPLGETTTDPAVLDHLEAHGGAAAIREDYCHSFEHAAELQVVFLQYVFGPAVRVVPVLCGRFGRSLDKGGHPEDDPGIRQFLDALGALETLPGRRIFWVLGIDMAHMGSRYYDPFPAIAGEGIMNRVEQRDRERIAHAAAGDAHAFWELVRPGGDDLKWCGASPLYAFLKAVPGVRGRLLHYQQWNIDPRSTVSFAGLAFSRA